MIELVSSLPWWGLILLGMVAIPIAWIALQAFIVLVVMVVLLGLGVLALICWPFAVLFKALGKGWKRLEEGTP